MQKVFEYVSIDSLLLLLCSGFCSRLEGRNWLSLHSSKLHLFLKLMDIADPWEKVGLSITITIKCRKPTVPLPFGGFGFFEIANHGEVLRGKESIVDDGIVFPTVASARHIIIGLSYKLCLAALVVKTRAPDIVELEGILFKDTSNARGLNPQKSGKKNMKTTSKNSNQRWGTIHRVGCRPVVIGEGKK